MSTALTHPESGEWLVKPSDRYWSVYYVLLGGGKAERGARWWIGEMDCWMEYGDEEEYWAPPEKQNPFKTHPAWITIFAAEVSREEFLRGEDWTVNLSEEEIERIENERRDHDQV